MRSVHGISAGEVEMVGEPSTEALGSLLSDLRREAGLSINALGGRADVSPGLISQIERGQGNPSYTTLLKLARALNTSVGRLFGVGDEDERHGLVRIGARRQLVFAETDMIYELLTPTMQGRLGMIQARIAAGWSNEEVPYVHVGEECLLLVEGRLHANIGGVEYDLCAGDSLTYDSSQPHWWRNETDETAVIVGAMTPPSF